MPKFTKKFSLPIDQARLADLGKEQARIFGKIEEVEQEKRLASAEYNGKLKTLYADLGTVALAVRTGTEEREVECEWRPHPDRPFMMLWRLDTLEVLEERPMSDAEKQVQFSDKWQNLAQKLEDGAASDSATSTETATEDEQPRPARRAPPEPKCPAPVPGNPGGVCGFPGLRRQRGFCEWHVKHLSEEERATIAAARDAQRRKDRKKPAQGDDAPTEEPQLERDSEEGFAEDAADAAGRCTECGEPLSICLCEPRTGEGLG
jgi:hypothetical protein